MNNRKESSNHISRKIFEIFTFFDIDNIPKDTEELHYYCDNEITISLPDTIVSILFSTKYKHSLNFLTNTKITELGLWNNSDSDIFNNIPESINTLIIISLDKPLQNIPVTMKEIYCYNFREKILLATKIPFDCKFYHYIYTDPSHWALLHI